MKRLFCILGVMMLLVLLAGNLSAQYKSSASQTITFGVVRVASSSALAQKSVIPVSALDGEQVVPVKVSVGTELRAEDSYLLVSSITTESFSDEPPSAQSLIVGKQYRPSGPPLPHPSFSAPVQSVVTVTE
jgi:hypothetical protein